MVGTVNGPNGADDRQEAHDEEPNSVEDQERHQGADYLVPLKENQKTLLATAKTLLPETLSPSGGGAPPQLPS